MEVSKIGYCRISSTDQNMEAQLALLRNAGCEQIFKEQVSGRVFHRPELHKMLDYIRQGDKVIVTKLDRMARSTKDLLEIAEEIKRKGAEFEVLNIRLETSTPTGKLMLTMLAAIAEFERELMLERQREGIEIAKQRGVYRGRKPIDPIRLQQVRDLVQSGVSIRKAVKKVGIGRRTYYRALKEKRI